MKLVKNTYNNTSNVCRNENWIIHYCYTFIIAIIIVKTIGHAIFG